MPTLRQRVVNILFGMDETVNAALGGNPRETISGTVGRAAEAGQWWAVYLARPFINWLLENPQHCQEAVEAEARFRAQTGGSA